MSYLWPLDVTSSGYYYGWRDRNACVVVGVINADSQEDAESFLGGIGQLESLLVLGKCAFTQEGSMKSLHGLEDESPSLVYYHRHSVRSMRFYASKDLQRSSSPPQEHLSLQSDFTVSPGTSCGINMSVIEKLNRSHEVEAAVLSFITPANVGTTWRGGPPRITRSLHWVSALVAQTATLLNPVGNIPLISLRTQSNLSIDLSATVQQIDLRCEQAVFLAGRLPTLFERNQHTQASYAARYLSFYNSVWLITNDMIIGIAFGTFLCANHVVLGSMLEIYVNVLLVVWPQGALRWLNSWPAGLKLNTELSRFYAHSFIYIIGVWANVLNFCAPYYAPIIFSIGLLSCAGVTFSISLLSDTLSLLTAHIHLCYSISTTVYYRLLVTGGSLWNLFRGKRYNVLRERIDAWDYDVDQLLFGTILFTLVAFLFPTVLVYYALFALMRLSTILLQASMDTVLAFMNHFPLFALTLRVKDPWRLPGDIYFMVTTIHSKQGPIVVLKNKPVSLAAIFYQYTRLWGRLFKHYNPGRLIRCVITGVRISSIPQRAIRYGEESNLS